MGSHAPAMIQNENLHRGKGDAVELARKKKCLRDGRKALADLSKPPADLSKPSAKKAPDPKNRSARARPQWTCGLNDEEIAKCEEWAEEGIEGASFTGNDAAKLEKEAQEQRVQKEVEMVMSSLRCWSQVAFDYFFPVRETGFPEDIVMPEPEPDVVLPYIKSSVFSDDEFDDLLAGYELPDLDYAPIDIDMKDSDDDESYLL